MYEATLEGEASDETGYGATYVLSATGLVGTPSSVVGTGAGYVVATANGVVVASAATGQYVVYKKTTSVVT